MKPNLDLHKNPDLGDAGRMSRADYDAQISEMVARGNTGFSLRGSIDPNIADQLRNDGFRVTERFDSQAGLYWTRVDWEVKSPIFSNSFIHLIIVLFIILVFYVVVALVK